MNNTIKIFTSKKLKHEYLKKRKSNSNTSLNHMLLELEIIEFVRRNILMAFAIDANMA